MIDARIEELGNKGMISPFFSECVQPCSYDVHLGEKVKIETEFGMEVASLSRYDNKNPYLMPPGTFMLAETVEWLAIPNNVEAHLHLVSSRAREGLNHLLSGLVDCGYEGRLTLELKNSLQYGHIPLYPNLRIGQLTFFEYQQDACLPYRGRYFRDKQVTSARDGQDLLPTPGLQDLSD